MSTVNDLTQLGKLIAHHHGWTAAKAAKAYEMSEPDRAVLTKCGVDILKAFPPAPASSALMSAALAVRLEDRLRAPVHVVAGTLAVEGALVFGDDAARDAANSFGIPGPDWHGHLWVMIGAYIVDVSIFRTAYSGQGPAALSRHVDLTFGPNKGLYVDLWKRTSRLGLRYEPQYVLSAAEVTELMGGAYHVIRQARPTSPEG